VSALFVAVTSIDRKRIFDLPSATKTIPTAVVLPKLTIEEYSDDPPCTSARVAHVPPLSLLS
jgi:hypothetical protein